MKQLFAALFIILYFLFSGCAEMIFNETENKKQLGQTYEEYVKEEQQKEEQWRLHQKTYD